MDPGEALLLFAATFAGVLLAFALDGWRQRRAHKRWIASYVGGLVTRLEANLDGQRQVLVMLSSRTGAPDLVDVLQQLDDQFRTAALTSAEAVTSHRMFVAPLLHERVVPLSSAQRNAVRDARSDAAAVQAVAERLLDVLGRFIAAARGHGLAQASVRASRAA